MVLTYLHQLDPEIPTEKNGGFNPEKMVNNQDPTMKRNFIMKWSEHLGSNS